MVELLKFLNITLVLVLVGASLISFHPTFKNAIYWLISYHLITVVISWDGKAIMNWLSTP